MIHRTHHLIRVIPLRSIKTLHHNRPRRSPCSSHPSLSRSHPCQSSSDPITPPFRMRTTGTATLTTTPLTTATMPATATAQVVKPAKSDPTRDAFTAVFPTLVDDLLTDLRATHDLPDTALDHIRDNLLYNVPHGKLNRGLAVSQCFLAQLPNKSSNSPSHQDLYRAQVLGWCVELQQAFFLVADDIMDDSVTRRGRPCFFRLPHIGLGAINDAMILESMIFRLLHLKFADHPAYPHLMQLFHDVTYTTEIGQLLDLTNQGDGAVCLDRFTDDALARIYKYKTSHYTFYLPVALGMRLAGVSEAAHYEKAKQICLELGHYFQAQDDFLDAFGDPEVTGKVGTDIEEKTCTWLVVQALKLCSEDDKQVLLDNYGKKDRVCSDKVKALYRRLKVPEAFREFEQSSYERVRRLIDEVKDMPVGALEFLLEKIYKRER